MTGGYNPATVEPKWQAKWAADGLYRRPAKPGRPYFALTMYPYPSGNLHIGHWFAYAPCDANARFRRMRGHDVFLPFGFDAFGLPAENAAISRGIEPRVWTLSNVARMRQQLAALGAMFDWSAEIVTCEPEYYRWNQWFFLKFLEQGLAYRSKAAVDFCPSCNTTLAREQVVGASRACERCDTAVEKRELSQWFLKITDYADELLAGLDALRWPERVKTMQRNWIGRSEGAEIVFTADGGPAVPVFTTRPDTLFGATAVVLAPEHDAVAALTTAANRAAVESYRAQAARRTEIDRLAEDAEKTGVATGGTVRHPLSGDALPVWIADYVLPTYGTGAVMMVPAHDERDFAFARRYALPIVEVVRPPGVAEEGLEGAYTGPGLMVNSGPFDGLVSTGKYASADWDGRLAAEYALPADVGREAKEAIVSALGEEGAGRPAVTYRLRDWLISRQRYWGTPIPVVHCRQCGIVPVPEDELPVTLPEGVDFRPTGESPLRFADEWRRVRCPKCGSAADRDTDTMDTFVDSSWYQYRYLSPHYDKGPFDPQERLWLPVAQYTGGIEHATMHLLYTRFWTRVMRDMGMVDFDEPMEALFTQGIILGADSEKMSKSRGNVVDPDDLVAAHGADAVRAYLMFIGPWEAGGPWDPRGIQGVVRWLKDVWELATADLVVAAEVAAGGQATTPDEPAGNGGAEAAEVRRAAHATLAQVTSDLDEFAFNTALAALMSLRKVLKEHRNVAGTEAWDEAMRLMLLMMAPLVPHIAEELWQRRGLPYSIHQQPWPEAESALLARDTVEIAVQVRGKVRDRVTVAAEAPQRVVLEAALASDAVKRSLGGCEPSRVIYVPGRLLNLVP